MLNRRTPLRLFALLAFTVAMSAIANAQATRTWVSGVGDDVNPCSRTAPCKTFAGAISKTADRGEIDCLDPGGFGTVTITKNMTIDGTTGAGFGSILAAGTNGVNVNDSATATPRTIIVTLKNLSINGAGTGFDGIRFISGRRLYIEGCTVFNFKGNGTNSDGLDIAISPGDAGTFNVNVKNSIFENCTGDAIRMAITTGTLNSSFDNVVLAGSNNGLEVTGGTANISNSIIDGNAVNGLSVSNGAFINASSNQITSNGTGVNNSATVRLSNNDIYKNGTGLGGGGTYNSFGNNHILGNTSDGVTPPVTNPK